MRYGDPKIVMKKIARFLIVAVTLCYSHVIFSGSMETIISAPNWTGFYLGGNAGYWRSQHNKVEVSGSSSFINQTFPLGASNIANALAQVANQHSSLRSDGFIGGGQLGYNYQYCNRVLLGFDIDFDGSTNSNNTIHLQKTVNLVDFDENYVASVVVKQRINYLGTLRARLGYLYQPTFLIYATGGFAYGNVTLKTNWSAQESLGPSIFPTVAAQNRLSKTLTGWTAGAGIEWFFKPNWTANLEYIYYSLNNVHSSTTLSQNNVSVSPAVLWGSAATRTALSVSAAAIKVGINYHFC